MLALAIFIVTLVLVIRQPKNLGIGWGQYMKVGLILVPPVLLATLLALAVWLPLIR